MCLISICIERRMTLEEMCKAWFINGDGAGIVWMNDKTCRVEYIKGITEVTELYEHSKAMDLPHVIHFRLASIGGKDELLTQPFEISKDSPLKLHGSCERVLLMNGTDIRWRFALAAAGLTIPLDEKGKEEGMSDTRAFAMILSQHKNNEFLRNSTGALGKFVDLGFHKNDKDNPKSWIRHYGDFDEDDGILYSNLKWKWSGYHYQRTKFDDDEDWRGNSEFGAEAAAELKKKDKKLSVSQSLQVDEMGNMVYKLKPYSLMNKRERHYYRKFWNLHAPYTSTKYPLELPPNTVQPVQHEIGIENKVYDYEKERQEFMGGGCGSELFNRGNFF